MFSKYKTTLNPLRLDWKRWNQKTDEVTYAKSQNFMLIKHKHNNGLCKNAKQKIVEKNNWNCIMPTVQI